MLGYLTSSLILNTAGENVFTQLTLTFYRRGMSWGLHSALGRKLKSELSSFLLGLVSKCIGLLLLPTANILPTIVTGIPYETLETL